MNETTINNLINAGAKRWTKGNMDRLYINASVLIKVIEDAGRMEDFTWRGIISNRYRSQLSSTKTYIDIADGSINTPDRLCKAAAEIMLEKAEN